MSDISLGAAQRNTLLSLQKIKRSVDLTTQRLATGRKVSSALDNPQNFFAARALDNRAKDISALLNNVDAGVRAIEEASNGVTALGRLLDTGESLVEKKLEEMQNTNSVYIETLDEQILDSNPVAYWRLDEAPGAIAAINYGSIGAAVNATYFNAPTLGSTPLFDGAGTSAAFNGISQGIDVPGHAQLNTSATAARTVELVFNANTTAGRQVIFDGGGPNDALSIYIFNGSLYVNGRDNGAWGPVNISTPINAGETYHAALVFDFATTSFRGYLNGEEIGSATVNAMFPPHAAISIGRMTGATWFHDGVQTGTGNYFSGRVSNVAIYNTALSEETLASHVSGMGTVGQEDTNAEFNKILDQIDQLTADANYRGVNLLQSDVIRTYFNETRSSYLDVAGKDLTSEGLGIKRETFLTEVGLQDILTSIRNARETVRAFGNSLATDLSIIRTRKQFMLDTVNVLKSGADLLTDADLNEEGANLLAAQTQLNLATTSLSLAQFSNRSVLSLFA